MPLATVIPFPVPEGSGQKNRDCKTGQGTVLVVEDDPRIAAALSIRLKAAGYKVITAADAVNATALGISEQPDIMLLDISIPAGDGFIVAERVQKLSATTGIPFIFITASRKAGLREKAMALGATAFFEKPYDSGELLATIAQALEANRRTR